jgi:hypothetical protein
VTKVSQLLYNLRVSDFLSKYSGLNLLIKLFELLAMPIMAILPRNPIHQLLTPMIIVLSTINDDWARVGSSSNRLYLL